MKPNSLDNTILKGYNTSKERGTAMNNEEKILALLEQHSEMFAQINSRLDKMDERLNRMDSQLDKVDSRLDKVDSRLDKVDERLDRMEEYAEITRDGVNALLDWAEVCSETYSLPLPKIGQ
jgi:archaellum component FlaC